MRAGPTYELGSSLWDLIDRRAEATPDLVLAVDEIGRSITFGDYRQRVLETAAGFAALGVVMPGDVVSWILPTWIEATIVTGALDRLGATQNPMLNIYRDREVGFIAAQLRTKWFVVAPQWRGFDYEAMVRQFCDNVVLVERGAPLPTGDPATLPPPPSDNDRIAWVMYTSGTTAGPEGRDAPALVGRGDDTVDVPPALDHSRRSQRVGLSVRAYGRHQLVDGGVDERLSHHLDRGVQRPGFDPDAAPRRRDAGRCHDRVPSRVPRGAARSPTSGCFRMCAYPGGAAPKPPQLHYDLVREVGGVGIVAGYGLTEGAMLGMSAVWDPPDKLAHTEGRAADGMEIVAIGEDGAVLPPGVDGELRVRGPHMFVGYVDPVLTEAAFDENGFFRTGDIGHLDADGYVVITGRLKDVIIRKGENISAKKSKTCSTNIRR